MDYVLTPPDRPSVAISESHQRFAVRRLFCVGRNYAKHAREMGHDPEREPPFFFSKPADAVVDAGTLVDAHIPYPPLTEDFHHEIELAVAIGRGGRDIPATQALEHVFGYAVALDLTRRDLQRAAREKGRPWDGGKAFDRSAPIAPIRPAASVGHLHRGRIWIEVNGAIRQDADLAEMIWPVPDVIAILSTSMALAPGDIILTGTPAGVGPVRSGDTLRGGVGPLDEIALTITDR